jgi:RNA polymerase sigma factor (sigma-70 family)
VHAAAGRSSRGSFDGRRSPQADGRKSEKSELIDDRRRRLTLSVGRVCPCWLADQAEDIVQNAMIQLLASMKTRGGNPHFSTIYLRKVAHGATVDEIRRRCRRKEETSGETGVLEQAPSEVGDPERSSAAREIGRGIVDWLTELADSRRLAVTLFLRGCTVPEAARRLRWSVKKTEHLVYRALRDLRRCLALKGMRP